MARQFIVSMKSYNESFSITSEELNIGDDILFLDEVLTNSARMAVLSDDPTWSKRYYKTLPVLDKKIQEMTGYLNRQEFENSIGQTEKSNALLVEMDERAMDLVEKGKRKEAQMILFGAFYNEQKENYLNGVKRMIKIVNDRREKDYKVIESTFLRRYSIFGLLLILGLVLWVALIVNFIVTQRQDSCSGISSSSSIRMRKLLAILANDLRSYMSICQSSYNVMYGQIKTFLQNGVLDEHLFSQEEMENIEERHSQQIGKIDHLLNSMRLLSREHFQAQRAVCLDDCIENALDTLGSRSLLKNIKYSEDYAKERYYFYGYEDSFTHALVELLLNSIESISDSYHPWIKFSAKEEAGMIIMRLTDSGPEIPHAAKPKIFTPFFTTKLSTKSLGIGLSISREILRELEGTIEYIFEDGHNSFLIAIPKLDTH